MLAWCYPFYLKILLILSKVLNSFLSIVSLHFEQNGNSSTGFKTSLLGCTIFEYPHLEQVSLYGFGWIIFNLLYFLFHYKEH